MVEITEKKIKKLQEEYGIHGAMKIVCILYDAPLDILRSENELNKMIIERDKLDKLST